MTMSEQTKRRIEAAKEASRLVKQLPEWMLAGLQLTPEEGSRMTMPTGLNRRSSKLDVTLHGAGSLRVSRSVRSWIDALVEIIQKLRAENKELRRRLRGQCEES